MMNFSEICKSAESTRDEVYGWRVGSDRFGYDAVMFLENIKKVKTDKPVETEHRRTKRIKAENIARYRVQVMAHGEIKYDGHRDEMRLLKNQQTFCEVAIKAGQMEPFDDKF